ncbi:MAG: TolC family protein [Candidatus Omnitrophica bacterium]|nr:TolC family protein [Candidatus Omnitrophota bacterium]
MAVKKEKLTLERCKEIALKNNPEIAALEFEKVAAQSRRDFTSGAVLPNLRLTGSYNHYLDAQRLIPARRNGEQGVFSQDIITGEMLLFIPLFTGGRLRYEIMASDLLVKTAENRLARSREELFFNLTSVFYSLLAQEKVIESLEFSQRNMAEHLKRIEEFIAFEKAAPVDKLRVEVRIADLNHRLVLAKNILEIQRRVLCNLMGIENERDIALEGTIETIAETEEFLKIEKGITGMSLKNRKDYQAALSSVYAQEKILNAALAARWPTISLMGSYEGRYQTGRNSQGTRKCQTVGGKPYLC